MRPRHAMSARDAGMLLARLVLGTIVVTHGYQQLMVDGIGRTAQGMAPVGVAVAIVAASLATVVELVGGLLVATGLLTRSMAVVTGLVMVGDAAYVEGPHGVLVAGGGGVLAAAVGGGLAAVAAAGPGRWSVTHLARPAPVTSVPPLAGAAPAPAVEPTPPAGLPLVPLVHLTPARTEAHRPPPG